MILKTVKLPWKRSELFMEFPKLKINKLPSGANGKIVDGGEPIKVSCDFL
jgi:hypothetical protein